MFLDNNLLINQDKLVGIEKDVTCSICQGILNDPYFCNKCQNNFCNKCITKYKKNNSKCPFRCQDPEYISNRFLKKIFNELLKFKCSKGCDEIIPYKDVETHNEKCLKEDFREKYLESATQIEIFKVQIENYKDIENELNEVKERNNELEDQINELEERKNNLEEEIDEVGRLKNNIEEENYEYRQINNNLEEEINEIRRDKNNLEEEIDEYRERNNYLEQEIKDEQQNKINLENENNNLKNELEELNEKNKEINEKLENMNNENQQYIKDIEAANNKMIEYENIIKILNEEKNCLNEEILILKEVNQKPKKKEGRKMTE